MRILKNSIEVQFDNTPCFIHRENIAGIKCYKNDNIYKLGEYRVAIYLIHPIDQIDDFEFGCNDAEPYIAWFDDDYTPEKSIVRDTCKCCNEQMDSVSPRPAFANELLCNMCNDAKRVLGSETFDKLEKEKTWLDKIYADKPAGAGAEIKDKE